MFLIDSVISDGTNQYHFDNLIYINDDWVIDGDKIYFEEDEEIHYYGQLENDSNFKFINRSFFSFHYEDYTIVDNIKVPIPSDYICLTDDHCTIVYANQFTIYDRNYNIIFHHDFGDEQVMINGIKPINSLDFEILTYTLDSYKCYVYQNKSINEQWKEYTYDNNDVIIRRDKVINNVDCEKVYVCFKNILLHTEFSDVDELMLVEKFDNTYQVSYGYYNWIVDDETGIFTEYYGNTPEQVQVSIYHTYGKKPIN